MDKLVQRLKTDAADIRADLSPELTARLDAAAQAGQAMPRTPGSGGVAGSFWLASSLTGLAAAMLILLLVNWNRQPEEVLSPETLAHTPPASSQPELPRLFALHASTADLTEPLQDELENLKADLEKARDGVAQDLRSSF